jgi:hypothetical protein
LSCSAGKCEGWDECVTTTSNDTKFEFNGEFDGFTLLDIGDALGFVKSGQWSHSVCPVCTTANWNFGASAIFSRYPLNSNTTPISSSPLLVSLEQVNT